MKNLKFIFGLLAVLALAFTDSFAEAALAAGPIGVMGMEDYAQNNFSSFEGNLYTGEGDHFLDFGGPNVSFASEKNTGRVFVVNITNELATTENVTLIPGYSWTPGATDADKKWLVDGDIYSDGGSPAKKIIGSGSPKTIKDFLSYISKNPTNLAGIRISSNNSTTQIEQQLTVRELSPFRDLQSNIINAGSYTNERAYKDKMVTVPTPGVVLGPETEIILPVIGNSVCTVTFFCGAVLSTSAALKAKRNMAASSIAAVGLDTIVRNEAVNMPKLAVQPTSNPIASARPLIR